MSAHFAYRHVQTYTAVWLIDLVIAAVTVPIVLSVGDGDRWLDVAPLMATVLGIPLFLGRLVIEVDARRLRWRFGYVGWPVWAQDLSDVVATEVARADVSRLSSGIQGTRQHRQFNVAIGGPALRLTLADGRQVTLGTPEPQRLQGFVDARRPDPRR